MSNDPENNGWEVSNDDAALLDAFESGGVEALQGMENEDDRAIEEFVAESVNELSAEIEAETEESVATEEESLDEDEETEVAEDESEGETSDGEEEPEYFYVDGPRGKKLEVPKNPSQDEIAKAWQAADRAKLFQSELDKQKNEYENLQNEMTLYREDAELFKKLETMADDLDFEDPSSFNQIIRAMTNDQLDMDALIEQAIEEREALVDLTDDQIAVIEKTKELKRREREIKKAELRHQRDKENSQKESQIRMENEQRAMINNALLKHDVRGKLGDQARENGIMERAWHEALRKMTAKDDSGNPVYSKLSPEIVEEIIKSEIEFFAVPSEKVVEQKVNKAVKRQRASATKAVQNAIAPKSAKKSVGRSEFEDLSYNDMLAAFSNIDLKDF